MISVARRVALRGYAALLAAVATCWSLVNPASAQEWTLSSGLSQTIRYNSNLLLTPHNRLEGFSSLTTPSIAIQRASPTSTVRLEGLFDFAEYFGHSEFNSQDQTVNLDVKKDLSERSSLGFTGDFIRDTTLESDDDVSGEFIEETIHYMQWDAAPSWTYLLSPIDTLTVGGSYRNRNYTDHQDQKVDYQYWGPTFTYSHQLSELASVFGSLSWSRYEADNISNTRSDVYGGLIGYQYTPTERFTVTGQAGVNYSVTHQDDVGAIESSDEGDAGYRLKFDMTYAVTDQTTTELVLSHDAEPSGAGRLVTRNRGRLTVKYALTELTTLKLDGVYYDNQDYFGSKSGSGTDSEPAKTWSISPSVIWKVTEHLDLGIGYRYSHKNVENSGSASDNAAFIQLSVDLPDQSWSGF